jgi:hypothetical protein
VAVEVVALDELEAEAQAALEETTRPDEAVSPDELEELAPANESAGELVEAVDERELEPPEVHMEVVDDEDDLVVYQEPAMERLDHQAERLDHQAERLDHQAERVDHQAERVEHRERIEHVEQQHQPHQQPPPAEMISNGGGGGPIDQGPPPPTGDPFLDELRRVTTEEPTDGDPITDFLEEDGTNRGSGWFGRKR